MEMSAIEKAAAMLRQEAEGLKAGHTLRGDWCGDPTEGDYREMIAVAAAAIAERDELLEALKQIAGSDPYRQSSAGRIARAAIARATGEQP
jgi:hypothetical protein